MAGALASAFGVLGLFGLFFTDPWVERLAFAAIGLTCAVLVWVRWSRQGIYADELFVEIRGSFVTRRISWSDIALFELRREARDMVTWVDLKDGTSVAARALNAGSGISKAMRARAQVQVDELNELLRRRSSRIGI